MLTGGPVPRGHPRGRRCSPRRSRARCCPRSSSCCWQVGGRSGRRARLPPPRPRLPEPPAAHPHPQPAQQQRRTPTPPHPTPPATPHHPHPGRPAHTPDLPIPLPTRPAVAHPAVQSQACTRTPSSGPCLRVLYHLIPGAHSPVPLLPAGLDADPRSVLRLGLTPRHVPLLVEHAPGVATELLLRLLAWPERAGECDWKGGEWSAGHARRLGVWAAVGVEVGRGVAGPVAGVASQDPPRPRDTPAVASSPWRLAGECSLRSRCRTPDGFVKYLTLFLTEHALSLAGEYLAVLARSGSEMSLHSLEVGPGL
jgi:hypothetical protein